MKPKSTCNADTGLCGECNASLPEGRQQFCSNKCATRVRVRRHRLKHSGGEGPAHFKIRRAQQAKDVERAKIDARKALRCSAARHRNRRA